MKKVSIILAGLLLVTVGFVFAQGNSQNMGSMMDTSQTQSSTGMWGQGMWGQGMMGQGMMYGLQGQDMPMMGMTNNFSLLLCHFGCPGFLLDISDDLNLTDQQISNLKMIMSNFQKYAIEKRAGIRISAIEVTDMLDTAKPDFVNIKKKVDGIVDLEKDLTMKFLDTIQDSRNLLTADQVKMLQNYDIKGQRTTTGTRMGRHRMMHQ